MSETNADDTDLRIVRSESFERKQQTIRNLVLECLGSYESVLELGGVIRNSDIVITDCLIPRATLGYSRFRVLDRDLSRCWSEAEKGERTRHLKPVGDLHYHPGNSAEYAGDGVAPGPSSVDEANSLRQSSLYSPFNLQTIEHDVIPKTEGRALRAGYRSYTIDPMRSILVRHSGKPGAGVDLVYREKEERAMWASLIYPSDGFPKFMSSTVIVHSCRHFGTKVHINREVPAAVLSDKDVAQLTGWPLESIELEISSQKLKQEVNAKYRAREYPMDWSSSTEVHENTLEQSARGKPEEGNLRLVCCNKGPGKSEVVKMAESLRRAASLMEEGMKSDDHALNEEEEDRLEESIWDLSSCIGWLRNRKNRRGVYKSYE
ncbi:MAG: hypothetical protein C4576_35400 [Desulfobacteraceae bacterium]|nr:MAG: hypothetical protein C4576_35400 [Desulfobacteraceae bacterium]